MLVRAKYAVCVRVAPADGAVAVPPVAATKPSRTRLIVLIVGASVVAVVLAFVSGRVLLLGKARGIHEHVFFSSVLRHGVTIDSNDDHALLEWRIDAEELLPIRRIAMRPYGSIWLANYLSETVVVKRINQKHISARAQQDFVKRLAILGRLDHPNILRLIGVAWTTEVDVQIVVEYMSIGNLRRYLTLTKDDALAKQWSSRKVAIALSIAHALVYIHSRHPQVLHRDLKSRSVLLDEDLSAKVSGFGLRYYRSEMNRRSVSAAAPKSVRTVAPEVLAGESDFSEAADMYSFGIILGELDSHELPFSDVKLSSGEPLPEQAMLELLVGGALQPTLTANCPKDVGVLLHDCMSLNPDARPSALEVVKRLQSTMDHLQRLSEIGEDLLSGQERLDSFLGQGSSGGRKMSSHPSFQRSITSSGRNVRSTSSHSSNRDFRSSSLTIKY